MRGVEMILRRQSMLVGWERLKDNDVELTNHSARSLSLCDARRFTTRNYSISPFDRPL